MLAEGCQGELPDGYRWLSNGPQLGTTGTDCNREELYTTDGTEWPGERSWIDTGTDIQIIDVVDGHSEYMY